MTDTLDDIDRLLIDRLQDGLAIVPRPFAMLAGETKLSEQEIVERISGYLEDGYLSRFGPMFNADRMGGAFCLCAIAVPDESFSEVMDIVNGFREVAHNYEREHRLNMWFVLATETAAEIAAIADEIEARTGLKVYRFPKEAEFFIGLKVPA
ncbi:MAG: Lrp/AsnC family transcriptional regulator [Rhodobiaceae bacterium]|nr:Lrp/AsnC family transcriptional regulator [Rhodobiaceae bacterium]